MAATVLTPVTALSPLMIITYSLLKGRPKKFLMVRKWNRIMDAD
jgi:hypothetical protein